MTKSQFANFFFWVGAYKSVNVKAYSIFGKIVIDNDNIVITIILSDAVWFETIYFLSDYILF